MDYLTEIINTPPDKYSLEHWLIICSELLDCYPKPTFSREAVKSFIVSRLLLKEELPYAPRNDDKSDVPI